MKKQLLISVGAASVFLLSLFSASCATTKTENYDSVNYVQVKDASENLLSEISYPEIKGMDLLNKAIEQYVAEEWELIKKDSEAAEKQCEYIVSSEIFSSDSIVSVLLNTYEYSGGAHGEIKLKSFNFDTKQNKFVDITQASGYSLEELSDISRKSLSKTSINENEEELPEDNFKELEEMILLGTTPADDSFKTFILDGDNLVLYFEPAVVAAHSEGIQTVSVKIKK